MECTLLYMNILTKGMHSMWSFWWETHTVVCDLDKECTLLSVILTRSVMCLILTRNIHWFLWSFWRGMQCYVWSFWWEMQSYASLKIMLKILTKYTSRFDNLEWSTMIIVSQNTIVSCMWSQWKLLTSNFDNEHTMVFEGDTSLNQ